MPFSWLGMEIIGGNSPGEITPKVFLTLSSSVPGTKRNSTPCPAGSQMSCFGISDFPSLPEQPGQHRKKLTSLLRALSWSASPEPHPGKNLLCCVCCVPIPVPRTMPDTAIPRVSEVSVTSLP